MNVELDVLKHNDLLRTLVAITSAHDGMLSIGSKRYLNFSSNNYLDLADDPRIIAKAYEGMKRYGVGGMNRKGLTRKGSVLLYFSHPAMKLEDRVWSESSFVAFHGKLCKA